MQTASTTEGTDCHQGPLSNVTNQADPRVLQENSRTSGEIPIYHLVQDGSAQTRVEGKDGV